jgi:hypothetical protein
MNGEQCRDAMVCDVTTNSYARQIFVLSPIGGKLKSYAGMKALQGIYYIHTHTYNR